MTRAEEHAEKPLTLMELMDNVKRRLQGLIRMAEGQDENDGIQIADKAWLLATVDDVTALVDAFVVAPVVPEAKAEALAEELRLREESQIPVIPRAAAKRLADAEADAEALAEALEIYADWKHWAVGRDDFNHPSLVWIGPGATEPIPNGPKVARAALARYRREKP